MKKNNKKTKKITDDRSRVKKGFASSRQSFKHGRGRAPSTQGELVEGKFSATSKKYGFLVANDKEKYPSDFFVPPNKTRGALEGDLVVARIISGGERSECEIVEIIERANSEIVGSLYRITEGKMRGVWQVIPSDRKIDMEITVTVPQEANEGDLVKVEITQYPRENGFRHENNFARGKVTRIFGPANSKDANYGAILAENNVPISFSDEAIAEAAKNASEPISSEGRLDLRDEIIFTIDGSDAKDLDDAISLAVKKNGYLLGVHIADVSHYVRERTKLDGDAFLRGTSLYFTDKVVPMLPESLSNDACSLNAGTDKYALSAFVSIDKKGNITGTEIKNTIIRSSVRGVYSEVNDILDQREKSEYYEKYSKVADTLFVMEKLYILLERCSAARGVMELESDEARIILDESGAPVEIIKRTRGNAERLIEQFMLKANEGVAFYMSELKIPCVYRVHENPNPEKVKSFMLFAESLGIDISGISSDEPEPAQFAGILEQANKKGIAGVVSNMLLRSLAKARYSNIRSRHFGLSLEYYCHFTSPIRRYPDLSVHRILKAALASDAESAVSKYLGFAEKSAVKSTECELRALTAERAIDALYKTIYMAGHVDEEFEAVISSLASFGMFVMLDNTCEGLVPISSLDGFFEYDDRLHILKSSEKAYHLGDRLKVRVVDADIIHRRVEMTITG